MIYLATLSFLALSGSSHTYNTRHGHLFRSDVCKLKIKSQLPFQAGLTYFNLLPRSISSLGLQAFKKLMKSELLHLAPYDLAEINGYLPKIKVNKG